MAFLLASPSVTPSVAVPSGFSMAWTGWDGSVWSLSSRDHGLILGPGLRGLGSAPVQRFADESPAVAGSRWRGSRTLEREVFWPLDILHDAAGQDWIARDRAFWRTMDPERPGMWSVEQPNGERRTLLCRWSEGDDEAAVDPALIGWARYGVRLVAEDPYWRGAPIVKSFSSGSGVAYFSSSGSVYGRSPSNLLASATLSNPGDVDAWPTWTVTASGAGITEVSVGVGGRVVEAPIVLAAGQSVTINSAPAYRNAVRETGADVTASLGEVAWGAVPAGESQPLDLTMTGDGTVTVSLSPGYRRAW